jgi:hypothetical protein
MPLTNETETSNGNIEHKEGVYRDADTVPHHARTTQNTYACSQ